MSELKLKNITTDNVQVRIIPLTKESYMLDPNQEFTPLDSVEFEYGINLKGLQDTLEDPS